MPTHVHVNKLQAQVRYTHVTCRYPWIREPEPLIVRDVLTGPKNTGEGSAFLGEDITHIPFLLLQTRNLQFRSHGEPWPRPGPDSSLLLCFPLLIPAHHHLLSKSGPDVSGENLYKHCTFDLCVQSLTHTHTPLRSSIRYTRRNPGLGYTTTNLPHSGNINSKSHRLYL